MKLLALESSTLRCSVVLLLDGVPHPLEADADARNSEVMLPMVRRVLADAGLRVQDLDAIAFGAGPGAFTGLRVACGAAQGLAFAAGLPVLAVGTLEILAESLHAHRAALPLLLTRTDGAPAAPASADTHRVLVGMDARMGECYWGEALRIDADWVLSSGPLLCRPDQVPIPNGQDWDGVGDAFSLFEQALAERLGSQYPREPWSAARPDAGALARLAAVRFARGAAIAPEQAQPVYVRDKIALTRQERGVGP